MKFLYIEDDEIDIKSCKMLCSGLEDVQVDIVDDFEKASHLIAERTFDFVISDQRLGLDSFEEFWHQLLGLPYFILSNSPNENYRNLLQPPLEMYNKPITGNTILEMMQRVKALEPSPNLEYAEMITGGDKQLLSEMVFILKRQFEEGRQRLPDLQKNNEIEEIIQVVHKLISKFTVLSMEDSFSFFNRVEKCLRDNIELNPYAYKRLVSDLERGNDFINLYIETHELHNS